MYEVSEPRLVAFLSREMRLKRPPKPRTARSPATSGDRPTRCSLNARDHLPPPRRNPSSSLATARAAPRRRSASASRPRRKGRAAALDPRVARARPLQGRGGVGAGPRGGSRPSSADWRRDACGRRRGAHARAQPGARRRGAALGRTVHAALLFAYQTLDGGDGGGYWRRRTGSGRGSANSSTTASTRAVAPVLFVAIDGFGCSSALGVVGAIYSARRRRSTSRAALTLVATGRMDNPPRRRADRPQERSPPSSSPRSTRSA